jgi:hypothetical protein
MKILKEEFRNRHDFFEDRQEVESILRGDTVLVLNNVLSKHEVSIAKKLSYKLSLLRTQQWKGLSDLSYNYHRIITPNTQSVVQQLCQRSIFYLFNPELPPELLYISSKILSIKNDIVKMPKADIVEFTRKPSSAEYYQCSITNYPQGGGWLGEHTDPISSYGVIHTLSNLSDQGVDFESGGLYFRDRLNNNHEIYMDDLWKSGDVIIYNASLIPHRVEFIDPEKELNWGALSGRWTMSPVNVVVNKNFVAESSKSYVGRQDGK